jgi:hypothetical protein
VRLVPAVGEHGPVVVHVVVEAVALLERHVARLDGDDGLREQPSRFAHVRGEHVLAAVHARERLGEAH